jgi:L-2-hydroxycarboxylate dehydrogenase (NAD+)
MVLDIATTVSSYGRIKLAADAGETLPIGWVMDQVGDPITDPTRAREGFLVPIGGHKGYGLNLVIGLLAGVLNTAAFGSDVVNFLEDYVTPTNTGHLIIAVRPDLFRPLDEFKREVDAKVREMRGSRPMRGHGPPRIPGDRAWALSRQMTDEGIPISAQGAERLASLARVTGSSPHPFA